jgi:hypothetical protein
MRLALANDHSTRIMPRLVSRRSTARSKVVEIGGRDSIADQTSAKVPVRLFANQPPSRARLNGAGHCPGKEVIFMTNRKIGRDAKTGEFIPVKEAIRRPTTTTVETIKVDTKKSK